MPKITTFLKSILLFSAAIWLTGFLLFTLLLRDHYLPVFNLLIIYFLTLSVVGRLVVANSDMSKSADFNNRYFFVRWLKMLLHLSFIIVYLLYNRENIFQFIIVFLTGYLLYSVFDIYTLNDYLKKK
jgi:hypothetical protein